MLTEFCLFCYPALNHASYQRAHFRQQLTAEDFSFDCQTSALVVAEENATLAQLFFKNLIFRPQVLNHLLLLLIDPAGQDNKQELPGLENKVHG